MQEFDLILEELHLFGGKSAAKLSLPLGITLGFGQYLLASTYDDLLPAVIFPQALEGNLMLSTPEIPSDWKVGSSLHVRGPLGKRFQLPAMVKRLVCASARDAGYLFKPIISSALLQSTSLVMCLDDPVMDLPDLVELQPIKNLPDLISWTDLILLDISLNQVDEFKLILNNVPASLPVFAFIHVPMPCAGISDCGLCAVQTSHGIKSACMDGPIFAWHELRSMT